MKVYYDPAQEYLPYILQSALWSYHQSLSKMLNITRDNKQVENLLVRQKLLNEIIYPAVNDPMAGPELAIICDNREIKELVVSVLTHYLEETREIIKSIKDEKITRKCMEDIDIIKNQIIAAIKLDQSYLVKSR